jgi:hypothetical protein
LECRCHASESSTAAAGRGLRARFLWQNSSGYIRSFYPNRLKSATTGCPKRGGVVKYDGQAVNTWNPNSKFTSDYVSARRCARDALDRVMTENRKWISSGLEIIEQRLAVEKINQITPPQKVSQIRWTKENEGCQKWIRLAWLARGAVTVRHLMQLTKLVLWRAPPTLRCTLTSTASSGGKFVNVHPILHLIPLI